MDHEELKEVLSSIFGDSPEVESVEGLIRCLDEAGQRPLPSSDEIRKACESLVDEGVLQRAGREGFEATLAHMEEHGHDLKTPR